MVNKSLIRRREVKRLGKEKKLNQEEKIVLENINLKLKNK
jgi:hypothetical protein